LVGAHEEAAVKTVIESAGRVASRVRVGDHELTFDQPSSVPGGENRGPSPLDVMAISVGACAHYFAAAFLFGRNLPVDALRVEVEFEKTKEPVPRIGALSIRVLLPDALPAAHISALERAVRRCPAYGTLAHPPNVTLELVAANPEKGANAA
jgi:putative redox protein